VGSNGGPIFGTIFLNKFNEFVVLLEKATLTTHDINKEAPTKRCEGKREKKYE
jgi:hypothetical protein